MNQIIEIEFDKPNVKLIGSKTFSCDLKIIGNIDSAYPSLDIKFK